MENEMTINGEQWIKKTTVDKKDGLTLCIVRTYSAGVFLAYIDYESETYQNVTLVDSIRIWKWDGAFTLTNLAVVGTTKPNCCRFSIPIQEQKVNRVIEKLPVSEEALKTLEEVEYE